MHIKLSSDHLSLTRRGAELLPAPEKRSMPADHASYTRSRPDDATSEYFSDTGAQESESSDAEEFRTCREGSEIDYARLEIGRAVSEGVRSGVSATYWTVNETNQMMELEESRESILRSVASDEAQTEPRVERRSRSPSTASTASEAPDDFCFRLFPTIRSTAPWKRSYTDEPRRIAKLALTWAAPARLSKLYSDLESLGYATIESLFDFNDPLRMLDPADGSTLKYAPIFQALDPTSTLSDPLDRARHQAQIPYSKSGFKFIHDGLSALFSVLFPGRKVEGLTALRSLPGCQPQIKHTDFAFPSRKERNLMLSSRAKSDMTLLFLISLQPGTTLRIWPGSHSILHSLWASRPLNTSPHPMTLVNLPPGTLLVFRPDLVHAGSGFTEENFRVHGVLTGNVAARHDATNILARRGSGYEGIEGLFLEEEGDGGCQGKGASAA